MRYEAIWFNSQKFKRACAILRTSQNILKIATYLKSLKNSENVWKILDWMIDEASFIDHVLENNQ